MNDYLRLLNENRLTLIMSLPKNDPALCEAAFEAGADVVKVHINVDHRASGTHFGPLAEELPALSAMLEHRKGPMGIVLGGTLEAAQRDMAAAAALPFSFYSLYAQNVPPALLAGGVPVMAACDSAYSLDEIAEMGPCGAQILEASIVPGGEYGTRLSMRDLLRYSAIVRRSDLPVVVPTQRLVTPEDVPALVKTGVRGLMIGAVVTGHDPDGIQRAIRAFRAAIAEVR
ncbi:MAG: hypothetical protein J5998_11255 [Clostridia bacterium]|nr:hypothetical protein [Clostridia bacterium]